MTRKTRDVVGILVLAFMWGALVFVIGTGGDFPLNDDWVHALSLIHI